MSFLPSAFEEPSSQIVIYRRISDGRSYAVYSKIYIISCGNSPVSVCSCLHSSSATCNLYFPVCLKAYVRVKRLVIDSKYSVTPVEGRIRVLYSLQLL